MSDHLRRAYLDEGSPTLHGNLPGVFTHDSMPETRTPVYTAAFNRDGPTGRGDRNDRYLQNHDPRNLYTNRPLRADGRLNLRSKEWSGTTYMLAPCPQATDSQETKSLVLENAIETIRGGTGRCWRSKIDCLINHFNQPLVLITADLETSAFNLLESNLYQYNFLQFSNVNYSVIPAPPQNNTDALQKFRTEVRYVSAEMTLDPRAFFAREGIDGNHRIPGANTKTIHIRLPHVQTNQSTQVVQELQELNTLTNIRNLIIAGKRLSDKLQFGTIEKNHFTQDVFDNWIEDTRQRTRFEIVCRLIRPAFVGGDGLVETPLNRLVKCKQINGQRAGKQ